MYKACSYDLSMRKNQSHTKKFLSLTLSLIFLACHITARNQDRNEQPFTFSQYALKNGLHIILDEDSSLPLVSVVVAYNVGSINEPPGKAGLAYLMENLMFMGSANVSPMQHISMINLVGGRFNATTTEDKTIFQQTVPSNQLSRVLWLESDRMKYLKITEANVEQAKRAVIEEIRFRKSAEPYLESFWRFDQLLYPDYAYSHPVIGNETDLMNLTVEDVKQFYSTYYIPNNAVLSIVGNIEKGETFEEIQKYFSTLPRGKKIPPSPIPRQLEKKAVAETLVNPQVPMPGFHLGYTLTSPNSVDFYPLKIIEYILAQGKTSRLYKKLIKKERIARHFSGGIEIRKDQARFKIFVLNNNVTLLQRSKRTVLSEINRLKSRFISKKELQKAKSMFEIDYLHQYMTTLDRSLFLAETFLSSKSLNESSDELGKYLQVTAQEIIWTLNRYFGQNNISLSILRK